MKKLIREVNDQEICRRLDILMHSGKDDIAPALIKRILEQPSDFDSREVPEPYTQYVKHYMYMLKRYGREKEKDRVEAESRTSAKKKTRIVEKEKAGAKA